MSVRSERGGRLGRGDIRGLLLAALLDGSAHGYQLMRRMEDASGGVWSPSPGSVYPTLQMLEDEGLLAAATESGRKTYSLTPAGHDRAQIAARTVKKPWADGGPSASLHPLREVTASVHAAARQVGTEGTPAQIEQAIELLRTTRSQLYRLLADD